MPWYESFKSACHPDRHHGNNSDRAACVCGDLFWHGEGQVKHVIFLLAVLLIAGCAPPHAINEMIIVYSAWESVPELGHVNHSNNFEDWEEK